MKSEYDERVTGAETAWQNELASSLNNGFKSHNCITRDEGETNVVRRGAPMSGDTGDGEAARGEGPQR